MEVLFNFTNIEIPYGDFRVFGNSVRDYVIALGALVLALIVFRVFQFVLLTYLRRLAKKTKTELDDMFLGIVGSVRPPFYLFLAFYVGMQFLAFKPVLENILYAVFVVWAVYQVVRAVQVVIDYGVEHAVKAKKADRSAQSVLQMLSRIVSWGLWIVAALFVLSNLGVNVSSALAGLGIGGIAIALAAQNILGDLFSSFVIFFDKPFLVGDFIVVGEHKGTVERIGVKTTRLRALSGEELVIPNKELTGARVQNYRRMERRRVEFGFGILYETPVEKVRKAKEIVQGVFSGLEKVELDRVHFFAFGDSALQFEVVYFLADSGFGFYKDAQERINLELMERFQKEGIEFAYPTQTLYVKK